jgi:uncharacterized protein
LSDSGLALVRAGAVLATFLAGLCFLTGCGGTPEPAKTTTQRAVASVEASKREPVTVTPASQQLGWVIGALNRGSTPGPAEFARHFSRSFMQAVPPKKLAAAFAPLAAVAPLRSVGVLARRGDFELQAEVRARAGAAFRATIAVSAAAPHLIEALLFQPLASPVASFPSVRQSSVGVGSPPLKGTLTLPAGRGPFPAVVLVSGSGSNDQDETFGPNKPFLDIAVGLAAQGIATLRYDKRTLDYPKSIAPKTFTPTQEYVPDAVAAIHLLEHKPAVDPHRIFVLGHSQGGTFAPLIAKRAPRVAGVILLAAATEPLGAAVVRQLRYLAKLPGNDGSVAKADLPAAEKFAAEVDSPAPLAKDSPGTILLGGPAICPTAAAGCRPAYFLNELRYNEVATARSIPQPLLLLQGDRDYQVTVANDLDVWLRGLAKRKGVTVVQLTRANHLFIDGAGLPTPLEYAKPGHVDPKVSSTITSWVKSIRAGS